MASPTVTLGRFEEAAENWLLKISRRRRRRREILSNQTWFRRLA